jgi:hypothetical protein
MPIKVTVKSWFDMGAIRMHSCKTRVRITPHFTQIGNHRLYNLALCGSLMRVHGLRVYVERDPAVGAPVVAV